MAGLFPAHGAPIAWEETEVAGRVDLADGSRLLPSGSGWLVAISGGKGGEEGRVLRDGDPCDAAALEPRHAGKPGGWRPARVALRRFGLRRPQGRHGPPWRHHGATATSGVACRPHGWQRRAG
jgi:hypothetical protein